MTVMTTLHKTLIFEREIPAPVEEVFAAFADLVTRTEWGAPSDKSVLIYDVADFREGGKIASAVGPRLILIFPAQPGIWKSSPIAAWCRAKRL